MMMKKEGIWKENKKRKRERERAKEREESICV
jgi:hypothetical protein